ncbi:MAG TPA: hypothetical protein PKA28_10995 [Methylomusa anaerophila]|uniref:Uncharacterized protein n=1 Tax=Methylomusa anaerophila TaxID=1930071 RepID=A0A348AJ37_9FIRM|nr:hypothetical protein [Methylomusa anaerophila]BBB91085.1 hypothetical protein MAMMFC1_01753 [Methylomusa anaerophila]HML88962.1 hypothetical protein [Methylomusa anaerophila]
MDNLFLIIFLVSIACLIVGLIKPSLVIRWGDPEKRGRKQVLVTYLSLMVLSFIAFGMTTDTKKAPQTQQASQQQPAQQKAPEKPVVKTYKSGQYKVGTDIPAGEYVAMAKGQAYIELAKDAKGTLDSILANDIFINRSIITVSDGQFIKAQNCELYAFKDAPKAQIKDGFLPSGMYKVGTDLPAGEYKVISEGGNSYIETSATSSHLMDDIISNDLFQGDKYVSVADGQYVKFFSAKIQVK